MHNKTAAIAARLADLQQRSRDTDKAAAADLQQLQLQFRLRLLANKALQLIHLHLMHYQE